MPEQYRSRRRAYSPLAPRGGHGTSQPRTPGNNPSQGSRPSAPATQPGGNQGGNRNNRRPRRGGRDNRFSQGRNKSQGTHTWTQPLNEKKEDTIPPIAPGVIRIIPLGGVEEVGQNMTMIEDEDDIVIIDCGFQFNEADTPGIDYILPNTKYLEDRKNKIRGIVITHGHLDHIGAIPYVMEKIGNPPIYSRRLTTLMIKKRQEEFPHLPSLNFQEVEKEDRIKIGKHFALRFFSVTHTIPDSMGVILETPYGSIVHTGDLKLEHENGIPSAAEEERFKVFEKENVLLLMQDSTNVERSGFSIPETIVYKNIEDIIRSARGRLIVGTFASQLERLVKIVEIAEKYKRYVVIDGRSMKTNIEIVRTLGMLKSRPGTFIDIGSMDSYPPEKIIVLATGAQGDEYASLMRSANKTHKFLKITPADTIVLSSSIIPGNERAVQKLKDNLSRQGADIIHYQVSDVHSSGHANRDETAWIHRKINPRFFIPVHGYHYMLRVHAGIAESVGKRPDHIVIPDNGSVIEIRDEGKKMVLIHEKAPSGMRMVDGLSIGDMQEVVIRDRKMLAQDGMFVIVAMVNLKTGRLRKSPDLISRGFVYLRESQDLLSETRLLIKKTIEDSAKGMNPINFDYLKATLTETVTNFLFQKTNKHPIVIPVLLGL